MPVRQARSEMRGDLPPSYPPRRRMRPSVLEGPQLEELLEFELLEDLVLPHEVTELATNRGCFV